MLFENRNQGRSRLGICGANIDVTIEDRVTAKLEVSQDFQPGVCLAQNEWAWTVGSAKFLWLNIQCSRQIGDILLRKSFASLSSLQGTKTYVADLG